VCPSPPQRLVPRTFRGFHLLPRYCSETARPDYAVFATAAREYSAFGLVDAGGPTFPYKPISIFPYVLVIHNTLRLLTCYGFIGFGALFPRQPLFSTLYLVHGSHPRAGPLALFFTKSPLESDPLPSTICPLLLCTLGGWSVLVPRSLVTPVPPSSSSWFTIFDRSSTRYPFSFRIRPQSFYNRLEHPDSSFPNIVLPAPPHPSQVQ